MHQLAMMRSELVVLTMEILVYAANLLYLSSYLVRDMLHLRILTIIAACCLVTYFYNQPEPMMTVVGWNLFFVVLNAIQLVSIVRSRKIGSTAIRQQSADDTRRHLKDLDTDGHSQPSM